jgi:hypothetical protein
MSRRRFTFCGSILVALVANACSPAADSASSGGRDDAGPSAIPDSGFAFETEPVDTGSVSPSSDTAEVETAAPCVPSGDADDPDDDFKDTNCDGIDGDKARAVFVSPDGNDDGAGTSDAPLKSIAKAVERANEGGKDVYVCNGTFAENVVLTKSVRLYGGYDCKTWKRTVARATIAPSRGTPVTVNSVTGAGVTLDRIALRAPGGSAPSESSIALFANQSVVVVRNGEIEAGPGADGASGAEIASLAAATNGANAADGTPRACPTDLSSSSWTIAWLCKTPMMGAQTTSTTIPSCEGRGGKGGNGGTAYQSTVYDTSNYPTPGAPGLEEPVGGKARTTASAGLDGSPGASGKSGAHSTRGIGSVSESGYVADNSGEPGLAGQNGGGGSGGWGNYGGIVRPEYSAWYAYQGGAGGEGGFGGCGGAAGKPGGGGGGSIAVLSFKSDVSLTRTTITTSSGGRGGAGGGGGAGQRGGRGGLGGRGTDSDPMRARGFDGGAGGAGGNGGNGGAGGGGPSIGVVYAGTKPKTDTVTFNVGAGGAGGPSVTVEKAANGEGGDMVSVAE